MLYDRKPGHYYSCAVLILQLKYISSHLSLCPVSLSPSNIPPPPETGLATEDRRENRRSNIDPATWQRREVAERDLDVDGGEKSSAIQKDATDNWRKIVPRHWPNFLICILLLLIERSEFSLKGGGGGSGNNNIVNEKEKRDHLPVLKIS